MTIKNFKISIVTVIKNSEKTIEKTIKSIIDQTYKNYQYIVIDGGSTDNTVNILESYKAKIDILIYGKDDGIWDAMNKSLSYVNGDIVGFLNSDDYYYNGALECVNKYFNNHSINFLFGSVEKYKLMHGFKPSIIDWSFGFYTSHSIGFFIKTDDHKRIGFYNKKYLSADLDFFYKMIKKYKMADDYLKTTDYKSIALPAELQGHSCFLLRNHKLIKNFFSNNLSDEIQ